MSVDYPLLLGMVEFPYRCNLYTISRMIEQCHKTPISIDDVARLVREMKLGDIVILFRPDFIEYGCLVKTYTKNNWFANKYLAPEIGGIIFSFRGQRKTFFGTRTFHKFYRAEEIVYHKDDKDVEIRFLKDLIIDLELLLDGRDDWAYCKFHVDLGIDEETLSKIIKLDDATMLISSMRDKKRLIKKMSKRVVPLNDVKGVESMLSVLKEGDVIFFFTESYGDIDKICVITAVPTLEDGRVKLIVDGTIRERVETSLFGVKYALLYTDVCWDYDKYFNAFKQKIIAKMSEIGMVPCKCLSFNLIEIYKPAGP